MKIAIASGKGGTGKTTVATNLAKSIIGQSVTLIDCDVDAADLHLLLQPTIQKKQDFFSSKEAIIDHKICSKCG